MAASAPVLDTSRRRVLLDNLDHIRVDWQLGPRRCYLLAFASPTAPAECAAYFDVTLHDPAQRLCFWRKRFAEWNAGRGKHCAIFDLLGYSDIEMHIVSEHVGLPSDKTLARQWLMKRREALLDHCVTLNRPVKELTD